ncbi:hypothetical protein [Pontibacter sp. G13]|uniref:hypothetical protein n=1 Tax=Pontibacter sp. G13 TaxID=3074898 RepID=UPI00288B46D3|nr:hypothetical protein [Pontibacter sp. G13]WNJ21607.1 hypothetical protein RJD25_28810 [Pontibacter sp. G13]
MIHESPNPARGSFFLRLVPCMLMVSFLLASGCRRPGVVPKREYERFDATWQIASITIKERTFSNAPLPDTVLTGDLGSLVLQFCDLRDQEHPAGIGCPVLQNWPDGLVSEYDFFMLDDDSEGATITFSYPYVGAPDNRAWNGTYQYELLRADRLRLSSLPGMSGEFARMYRGFGMDIELIRE